MMRSWLRFPRRKHPAGPTPIIIAGRDWTMLSTLSRDEVLRRLAEAGIMLMRTQTSFTNGR